MKMLPIYNILIGETGGVKKMSLVSSPAVESDFLAFDKQEPIKFSLDEEKHIVFGCALRADFPIYREDKNKGGFYVVFSKEVIEEIYEKFMIEGRTADVNLEHDKDTKDVYLIQSFIKDTDKGVNPIGFEEINNGSWFTAYKVLNEDVWNDVKAGKFNGFSVEGMFTLEPQEEDEIDNLIKTVLG